jgi:hypothetical protein
MGQRLQLWCVRSGVAYLLVWGSGLGLLAGWIPPYPAALDALPVAEMFRTQNTRILLGAMAMTVGAALYLPWTALLSDLIQPIEGGTRVLSRTQLIAGVMAQLTFFLPPYFWAAAAYRPLRDPEITQALADVGWLIFITGIGPFILQYACVAVAIFGDRRPMPAFPRWVGYLQVWISISFLPAVIPFFVKSGPFSWNGIFVWWLPLTLFSVWFCSMIFLARKAVLRGPAKI